MAKILSWAACLIWMALIFYLSHQPGDVSGELSSGITEIIQQTIQLIAPHTDWNVENWHYLVRKNAHFIAYMILGILVLHAFRKSGMSRFRYVGYALLISVLYAITDEVHQLFIPGRSGKVRDVLIDTAGALTGIGMYYVYERVRGRYRHARRFEKKKT